MQALLGSLLLLVVAVVSGAVWDAPRGEAVTGSQVLNNPGVVRIYEAGTLVGSGILVDRNWVLTAGPLINADPGRIHLSVRWIRRYPGREQPGQSEGLRPDRRPPHGARPGHGSLR